MCGSGTFPIEAALIGAKDRAWTIPRLSVPKWPSFRPHVGLPVKSAKSKLPATLEIYGFDRNERAILAAKSNVARADLAAFIQLKRLILCVLSRHLQSLDCGDESSLRTTSAKFLRCCKMLNKFGTRLANAWKGWRYAIVLPWIEKLNLPIDSRLLIKHGGLNVTVVAARSDNGCQFRV